MKFMKQEMKVLLQESHNKEEMLLVMEVIQDIMVVDQMDIVILDMVMVVILMMVK